MSRDRTLRRLLIANRGEIALRVARSARLLGIETVAVVTEADRGAPHARSLDQTVLLDDPRGYLSIDTLLEAARRSGADAVHPGYGFLAENADFAAACQGADLVWVGPSPDSIRAMADKAAAKAQMAAAGVPVLGGVELPVDWDPADVAERAAEVGYPLLVKAVAGGGGRGLRRVDRPEDLAAALETARSEAQAAFGDGRLMLERFVTGGRHVEVQILADTHGTVLALGERDCSVQRRHQKIVEESPSPAVDEALRARLEEAALAAARAVDYVGAGTVEMLLSGDGTYSFLEMNTRLQVEHPVTEMRYGLDLVAWQLRIAAGVRLPEDLARLPLRGHAIEARLYAEDPAAGFAPSPGTVHRWQGPREIPRALRVDHALADGTVVPPDYDPMLAKIVAYGDTRAEARSRLVRALADTHVLGPATNLAFLRSVLGHDDFVAGRIDTGWVEREMDGWSAPVLSTGALALAALVLSERAAFRRVEALDSLDIELWGWRNQAATEGWPVDLEDADGVRHALRLVPTRPAGRDPRDVYRLERDGAEPTSVEVEILERGDGAWRLATGGVAENWHWFFDPEEARVLVDDHGVVRAFRRACSAGAAGRTAAAQSTDGAIRAPMVSRVQELRVGIGDAVSAGQTLVVVEAMKLETRVEAPFDGTVAEVFVAEGDQVTRRQELLRVEAAAADADS